MRLPWVLAVGVLVAVQTDAQRFGWGPCPYQTVQRNFTFSKWYGRWFEQLKYYTEYQMGYKCDSRDYWPRGDGYVVVVQNRFDIFGRNEMNIAGTLTSSECDGVGKFHQRFLLLGGYPLNYWVLETDFTNYTIDWSCVDLIPNTLNRQYLWVLTRDRSPTEEWLSEMRFKIGLRGLDTGPLERMVQECANFNPPS